MSGAVHGGVRHGARKLAEMTDSRVANDVLTGTASSHVADAGLDIGESIGKLASGRTKTEDFMESLGKTARTCSKKVAGAAAASAILGAAFRRLDKK